VVHACNPSYSGGSDQEDYCPKSAKANIVQATLSRKYPTKARLWWIMSVILATQEIEIRRIKVQSQPRQIVQKIL
jgi:hypothetical protein